MKATIMAIILRRYVGFVMLLWAIVVLYMALNLYQLLEESRKSTQELLSIRMHLVKLKEENIDLRNETSKQLKQLRDENTTKNKKIKLLLENIRIAKEEITTLEQVENPPYKLSRDYEKLHRRISNQLREMWFYISVHGKLLENMFTKVNGAFVKSFIETFSELQQITELDFDELTSTNGAQTARDNLANKVSNIVQKRLHQLQHPADCSSAKKLVCTINKDCGYGCQMHHILYCFIISYSTKRTLIIESEPWTYSTLGWNAHFLPVSSSCVISAHGVKWDFDHEKHQVVHLPIIDFLSPRPKQMPLSVPEDLYDSILLFHGSPFVWWIGQFCKYTFKFQASLENEIINKKRHLGFDKPIVGVHIRRTDKIDSEALLHEVEEYMYWVELYYNKLSRKQNIEKKRVFISTDDVSVVIQLKKLYPKYTFLNDHHVSKIATITRRYTDESLRGIIGDIELLSDTDFLVCTFSSQVCRLAYEIMNNKYTDASQKFHSLDDIYYFGGQQEHKVKAIWPHKAIESSEIEFQIGDSIGIAGNHWNGQAKGIHHATQKSGLFPAYKVEDIHDVSNFLAFDDMNE